jgi:hypothetical protein
VLRNLPEHRSKVAGAAEVVGNHNHLVAEVGRNSEVCKHVSIDTRDERASNPTESSSSAGAGTAVVVDLHILRGTQIQDSLTFLLVEVLEKEKQRHCR